MTAHRQFACSQTIDPLSVNKLAACFALLAVFALLAGCGKSEPAGTAIRPALAFKIAPSGGSDMAVYSGEIRARIEADHAFRIGGKIAQRLVDAGVSVKRGQVLAQLDPQDVKLAAEAARALVTALQTEADFTDAELTRFRDLFSKGFVSQSTLDQKRNVASAARARLAAQQASANVSLNQSAYATLHAELDGVVTQVLSEAGQVVAAGQAIIKIANPRQKELLIAIPEAKIGEFRKGALGKRPIRVHLWSNPEKFYPGTLRELAAAADAVTRTFTARIAIVDADDSVGLGMSAYAAIAGHDADGSFTVPLSSLYVKGGMTGVWQIAADGRVTLKPVRVMQYRETHALVRADGDNAIKPGDTIVAAGVHKLREGEIVKPLVDPQVKGDAKVAHAIDLPAVTEKPAVAWLNRLQK